LQANATVIEEVLLGRRPEIDRDRARAIGTLFATVTFATVDLAFEHGPVDYRLIDELVEMLVAHLRPVVEPIRP
jgi:hypothetical protein